MLLARCLHLLPSRGATGTARRIARASRSSSPRDPAPATLDTAAGPKVDPWPTGHPDTVTAWMTRDGR